MRHLEIKKNVIVKMELIFIREVITMTNNICELYVVLKNLVILLLNKAYSNLETVKKNCTGRPIAELGTLWSNQSHSILHGHALLYPDFP